MKIEFDTDINGYQEARKFAMLLEFYIHAVSADQSLLTLIKSLQAQLDNFLSRPEFSQLENNNPHELDMDSTSLTRDGDLFTQLSAFLKTMTGPSRRELLLSKQRQELIERAEHAEASAFAALAETADIGRERNEALQKVRLLESELEKIKASGY